MHITENKVEYLLAEAEKLDEKADWHEGNPQTAGRNIDAEMFCRNKAANLRAMVDRMTGAVTQ